MKPFEDISKIFKTFPRGNPILVYGSQQVILNQYGGRGRERGGRGGHGTTGGVSFLFWRYNLSRPK